MHLTEGNGSVDLVFAEDKTYRPGELAAYAASSGLSRASFTPWAPHGRGVAYHRTDVYNRACGDGFENMARQKLWTDSKQCVGKRVRVRHHDDGASDRLWCGGAMVR